MSTTSATAGRRISAISSPIIETNLGRKAEIIEAPLPPGDVPETHADLTWIKADYGYSPEIAIDVGVPRFVAWYKGYHGID